MSLINDALKKAQRQRADAAPPVPAPSPAPSLPDTPVAPRIPKRRPPIPARTLMLLLVGGGLVFVTAVAIAIILLNLDSQPPVKSGTPPVHHTPPPPPPAPIPAVTLPPVETPAIVVPPKPAVPEPPPAPPKPVANPAVYTFLKALRVTGVRVAGPDSKVIMNDHIVRLGDYADRMTGLRLTHVSIDNLGFTDDAGFEYTKNLSSGY